MSKSMTAQTVRTKGRFGRRFTIRLSDSELEGVHRVADRKGTAAGALIRQWIRDAFKKTFGEDVD